MAEINKHVIVTIGRQIGSGGAELGKRLAARLGFALIDRQIMTLAARQLGVPENELEFRDERPRGLWERVAQILSMGAVEGGYTSFGMVPEVTDQQLYKAQTAAIQDICCRDTVLIGHAGFHVMRHRPGLVRVFVHAPADFRVQRLAATYKITDPADAHETIARTDRDRESYIRQIASTHWTDARNYDLSIDTSQVPMETAEQWIAELVELKRKTLEAM